MFVSFCCILFICSCYLSKHPSVSELLWYPSPDDGYWNQNIQHRLYITINSLIWIMFFCYLHTVRFWSIFTFIYLYISGDSSLSLLLSPPPPSVNFSSQPVVCGPKVSHHSCYCVILHCIAQIDKRTWHCVFFVNNQDTILFVVLLIQ